MDVPIINEKTLSYSVLYNIVGRRFHECLHTESQAQPALADKLTDAQLVHQVCRKERLTFYNFLKEHNHDGNLHTEEYLKEQINREYALYFPKTGEPREREIDIYESKWLKPGSYLTGNPVSKQFKVWCERNK